MLRSLFVLAVCIVVVLTGVTSALALDTRSGNVISVAAGETVDDDLAAAGQSVSIDGKVNGDALAAGQQVRVPGKVAGTLWAAGNMVEVHGKIGRSVWMAGNDVILTSTVPGNASLAGNSVIVGDETKVGHGLYAAGQAVVIGGTVGRELKAAGQTVSLSGTVNGDARIEAQNVRLEDGSVIRGNLTYVSDKELVMAPGAKVVGQIEHQFPKHARAEHRGFGWWKLYWIVATILFGILVVLLYPARSLAAGKLSQSMFWQSLLVGLLILIVTPIAAGIVMISLIGIPTSLVILASYFILIFASRIYAGIGLGHWILRKAGRQTPSTMLSMFIGLVVIGILSMIPWIGGVISFVALLVGLGAAMIDWSRWIGGLRSRGEA